MIKIPVYQPSLKGNEKKYINECIDSGWISGKGKFVTNFENAFIDYIQVPYATSVCNGTVALHLALVTLGLGPGDEVIVPTLTYISPVNAIAYTGATPVFADSLMDTWQVDPAKVERLISPKTKAIIAVHLYGHPCEMDQLRKIADKHHLFLIEDCAEAFGTLYKNKHVGTFGDISIFSFYGNKTITTGEGGMLVTNDKTLFERSVHFKGQGLAKYREYWHDIIGYNYRLNNISAAIGLAQLEKADEIISKKIQIAKWYDQLLTDSKFTTHKSVGDIRHSYWMYSALIPENSQRDEIRYELMGKGIETRPTFYPVHTMPMYSARYERHPVSENIGWRGMNLPSYPDLEFEQIQFITNSLKQAVQQLAA